ncbi:histidine kinase [Tenacibaculum aiptasiae]|uniref:Histidine kinase n=1 Tax=Tenacibaculum aiptasiae TaxID=426481 RepID=A0A7J5AHX2_9FLAO|nr:histidine kinase [Tenacibaculum aiptasiae]KAB1157212.1 histidine kinase [Tenacibaculum aiptasiae]
MNTKLDKSDWLILFVIFGATIILNCFDYYREGNKLIEYIVDFPTSTLISIAIILIFIQILVPKLLIKQKRFLLFFIIAILLLTLLGTLDNIIGRLSAGKSLNQISNVFLFLQKGLYNATDMVGFPLGILLMKKFYEGQNQFLKIEKQQKESELKLLRSQIDPHFLFNNLNTLDSLIDSDSEKAKEYINRLSLIYRYLIQTKDAEVMELSKELKFAENYIFLIETRFGNDYKFNIEKKVVVSNKFIPTGALQTLLENVVKHNKANKEPIETNITITEGWLTVKNTKTNTPNKESLGTGLENLQTRYELLSDKKIAIGNNTNKFIISIPVIKLSDEN